MASTAPPRILLVDCDAFYVQVARLEDPEGAGREPLLIVGGSPTGRGVVTSASYECRKFGVRSAMPTGQALRLCPDAVVVGVPRQACSRRSREVRETLRALAPVIQAASIDEFYLDLTGTERLFRAETLEATARRFREVVLERTGVSVSIGGGSNRLIAKLAAGCAKPAGVRVIPVGEEERFVGTLKLSDLPGVGPALLQALAKRGLHRVEEARRIDPAWLERWFGPGRGRWLHRRLRGIGGASVDEGPGRKSISSERTFFADVDDDDRLERELLRLVVSVAGTLRSKGLVARTVTLKVRDTDFTTRQRTHTLPEPVESDAAIFPAARALLHDLRRKRRLPTRLLGVGLTNLCDREEAGQLGLFEDVPEGESERDRTLAHTLDRLRERYGRGAVVPGRILARRHDADESHPDADPER